MGTINLLYLITHSNWIYDKQKFLRLIKTCFSEGCNERQVNTENVHHTAFKFQNWK
jgi:hypothetical protein